MTYKELLNLTRKYPNPFSTTLPGLRYNEYLEKCEENFLNEERKIDIKNTFGKNTI